VYPIYELPISSMTVVNKHIDGFWDVPVEASMSAFLAVNQCRLVGVDSLIYLDRTTFSYLESKGFMPHKNTVPTQIHRLDHHSWTVSVLSGPGLLGWSEQKSRSNGKPTKRDGQLVYHSAQNAMRSHIQSTFSCLPILSWTLPNPSLWLLLHWSLNIITELSE
jgi:hypothetical protein